MTIEPELHLRGGVYPARRDWEEKYNFDLLNRPDYRTSGNFSRTLPDFWGEDVLEFCLVARRINFSREYSEIASIDPLRTAWDWLTAARSIREPLVDRRFSEDEMLSVLPYEVLLNLSTLQAIIEWHRFTKDESMALVAYLPGTKDFENDVRAITRYNYYYASSVTNEDVLEEDALNRDPQALGNVLERRLNTGRFDGTKDQEGVIRFLIKLDNFTPNFVERYLSILNRRVLLAGGYS